MRIPWQNSSLQHLLMTSLEKLTCRRKGMFFTGGLMQKGLLCVIVKWISGTQTAMKVTLYVKELITHD